MIYFSSQPPAFFQEQRDQRKLTAKLCTSPKPADEFWARAIQQWLQLLSKAISALQLIFQESNFLIRFAHSMSLFVHHTITLFSHQGSTASCIMQRCWVLQRLTEKNYRVWLPVIQKGAIRQILKCSTSSNWSEQRSWSSCIINAWSAYKRVKSWSSVVVACMFPSSPFQLMVYFSSKEKDRQPSRFF